MQTSTQDQLALVAGARFLYKGRSYRLNTYMCEVAKSLPDCPILAELVAQWEAEDDAEVPAGMRRIKLRHCLPAVATYVSGSGICGCVAPISEIEVVGLVPWSNEDLIEYQDRALQYGREGRQVVTIVRPIEQLEAA